MCREMKKTRISAKAALIIAILLLVVPSLHAEQPIGDTELFLLKDLSVSIDAKADITIARSQGASLSKAKAEVSYYPREELGQHILSFNMRGTPHLGADAIVYEFTKDTTNLDIMDSFTIGYDGTVREEKQESQIKQKIAFPLKTVPAEVYSYTLPTDNIDSNNQAIKNQAVRIAGDETDLYILEYLLAEWVRTHVEYNLSTATTDISQKASWVLANKQGVCDEISSLFIAMNRALGIPARFVSGIAYTNSELFSERWGPHGWAEVYFPGRGWVPYDVTYGELGFVDASHITLMRSLDGTEPSVKYEWVGSDVELIPESLEPKVTLLEKGTQSTPVVAMKVSVLQDKVGIGSYNAIIVNLQNTADYYQIATLYFSETESLEFFGKAEQTVLLKPKASVKVYRMVKVSDKLSPKYLYTFPVSVHTSAGSEAKTEFEVQSKYSSLTEEMVEDVLGTQEQEQYRFEVSCSYDDVYFVGEEVPIQCSIKNLESKDYEGEVCLEDDCQAASLKGGKSITASFIRTAEPPAEKKYLFLTVKVPEFEERNYVVYEVVEKPGIVIKDLAYEEEVPFDLPMNITFILEPASNSPIRNLHVELLHKGRGIVWDIEQLSKERTFSVDMQSSILGLGDNAFTVTMQYQDKNGNPYTQEESFSIKLKDLTPWQWLLALLNTIG